MTAMTRRSFVGLAAVCAVGAGVGGAGVAFAGEGELLRPPGGQDERALAAACLKCDRCRSACPTGAVAVASVGDGFLRARTPVLDFHKGYCDFCGKCIEVCPTGALRSFDETAEKLGVAVVQKDPLPVLFPGLHGLRGLLRLRRAGLRRRPSGGGRRRVQRLRPVRVRVHGARVRRPLPAVRGGASWWCLPRQPASSGARWWKTAARWGCRPMKLKTKRTIAAVGLLGLVGVGLAVHTGTGTPSAWGIGDIAAICPLGAVEAAIASRTIVPPLLIGLVIVAVLVALAGRAFCAWGCPVPLLRRVFGIKERKADKPTPAERDGANDSRNWVLGATVLTTAAFGFPVFCLICPVGLSVATFIALWRLLQFSEATLSLVVFPVILVAEIVLLRKWCHRFCPLGALLGLMARLNRTFRPTVAAESCLHCSGASCSRCADVCPEGIDLHHPEASVSLAECTKCGECRDACPAHAISFPLLARTEKAGLPVASAAQEADEDAVGAEG